MVCEMSVEKMWALKWEGVHMLAIWDLGDVLLRKGRGAYEVDAQCVCVDSLTEGESLCQR